MNWLRPLKELNNYKGVQVLPLAEGEALWELTIVETEEDTEAATEALEDQQIDQVLTVDLKILGIRVLEVSQINMASMQTNQFLVTCEALAKINQVKDQIAMQRKHRQQLQNGQPIINHLT